MDTVAFAWLVLDAMEAGDELTIPGIGPVRPSKIVIPRTHDCVSDLNMETVESNVPKSLRGCFVIQDDMPANLIEIHDADDPARKIAVDPANLDAVAIRTNSKGSQEPGRTL